MKSNSIDDLEDDEDEEEFANLKLRSAPDLQTFFCDELYNYYHKNDSEEAMALFDPKREKINADNEFDCLNPRKHLSSFCDTSDDKSTKIPLRRTIETVTEETSSLN